MIKKIFFERNILPLAYKEEQEKSFQNQLLYLAVLKDLCLGSLGSFTLQLCQQVRRPTRGPPALGSYFT